MTTAQNQHRISSFCLLELKANLNRVSNVYWLNKQGCEYIQIEAANKPPNNVWQNLSWPRQRLPIVDYSSSEAGLEYYLAVNRMSVLVIMVAYLEIFLKDITRIWLYANGYYGRDYRITAVGSALAQPILRVSSVDKMVNYAASLFGVNFGRARNGITIEKHISKIYFIRCLFAHSGGVIKSKKACDELQKKIGENYTLSESDFIDCSDTIFKIAEMLDRKVDDSDKILWAPVVHLLKLKDIGELPTYEDAKRIFHELKFVVDRNSRAHIKRIFYS